MKRDRYNRLLKIDEETHRKLKQIKRELSVIEKQDISMGKIVKRILKGQDIEIRLKAGSILRRRKK